MSKETVTQRYWPTLIQNPVFQDIIGGLIDSKLYTSALYSPDSPALRGDGSILSYTNGDGVPKQAVALDVIVDVISRAILKNLQNGFDSTANTAANINYTYIGAPNISVNLAACANVSEAINLLGAELQIIKTTLQGLTQGTFQSIATLPPVPSTLIEKINIK